jgi:hypothetical protein
MVAGSGSIVAGEVEGVCCGVAFRRAAQINASAPIHRETLAILILPESLFIMSMPSLLALPGSSG